MSELDLMMDDEHLPRMAAVGALDPPSYPLNRRKSNALATMTPYRVAFHQILPRANMAGGNDTFLTCKETIDTTSNSDVSFQGRFYTNKVMPQSGLPRRPTPLVPKVCDPTSTPTREGGKKRREGEVMIYTSRWPPHRMLPRYTTCSGFSSSAITATPSPRSGLWRTSCS